MATNNSLIFHIEPYDLYAYFFDSIVGLELARRGMHHTFYGCFGYVRNLPAILEQRELVASELDRKGKILRELRAWDQGLVEIKFERTPAIRKRIEVWGYFYSKEDAAGCLSALAKHFPPESGPLSDGLVSMNFWNASKERAGESQPSRESQTMSVPRWHDIASNYSESVWSELSDIMRLEGSGIPASRLMLWRGLPGTGKTWALRALMREWSDWCTFHYIVDPGIFLSNSAYMLSVLSKVSEVREADIDGDKWSLIILEDAGEFIALDSRHQYGQALAKLLNLSDGLLGQGQRLLFLMTTNEELQNLHPAIVRQGRCLTNLEFVEFSEAEAREWMKLHGIAVITSLKKKTLSDLYALSGTQASIINTTVAKRAGFID